jgi:hypothetical protein
MFGRSGDSERLGRPAFRLAPPRGATVVRATVAATLVALALLLLSAGTPACRGAAVDGTAARAGPTGPGSAMGALGSGALGSGALGSGVTPPGPAPPPGPVPPPGTVGVPLVVAVPTAAWALRPGDRVDILAARTVLAEAVLVLAVRRADSAVGEGAELYVAAPPEVGRRLAGAPPDVRLTTTVRPP